MMMICSTRMFLPGKDVAITLPGRVKIAATIHARINETTIQATTPIIHTTV